MDHLLGFWIEQTTTAVQICLPGIFFFYRAEMSTAKSISHRRSHLFDLSPREPSIIKV